MAVMFTAIVVHGTVPDSFLYSTVDPIPKWKKGNASVSSNFRGITWSSIYGNCLIIPFAMVNVSCRPSYCLVLKPKVTKLCSMVLKKSMAYYVNHLSFVCF